MEIYGVALLLLKIEQVWVSGLIQMIDWSSGSFNLSSVSCYLFGRVLLRSTIKIQVEER